MKLVMDRKDELGLACFGIFVFSLMMLVGCTNGSNVRLSIPIGYVVNRYEVHTPSNTNASATGVADKSYGNGNTAILMDNQIIVTKGSSNLSSNNVPMELTVPAVGM
jgi:hypothetical protein